MTEHIPDGPAVKEVLGLLHRTSDAMTRMAQRYAEDSGSHPTDLMAVSLLARAAEPMTISELGAQLRLSRAATTALVDRLESAAHVRRVRHGSDRRQIHLEVTGTAHAAAESVLSGFLARTRAALADYTDDELAVARRLLGDVSDALASSLSMEPPEGSAP